MCLQIFEYKAIRIEIVLTHISSFILFIYLILLFINLFLGGSGGRKGGEKKASYLEKSRAFQSEIRMSVVVYPCRTSVALKKLSVLIKTDMHHSFQTYS